MLNYICKCYKLYYYQIKTMKAFFNILLILFVPFLNFSQSIENETLNQENTSDAYKTSKNLDDSNLCVNTYSVEIYRHINEETAKEIKNRLLNKKGICNVNYKDSIKTFEISTIEIINEKTIREFVLHTCKTMNIREEKEEIHLNQQK